MTWSLSVFQHGYVVPNTYWATLAQVILAQPILAQAILGQASWKGTTQPNLYCSDCWLSPNFPTQRQLDGEIHWYISLGIPLVHVFREIHWYMSSGTIGTCFPGNPLVHVFREIHWCISSGIPLVHVFWELPWRILLGIAFSPLVPRQMQVPQLAAVDHC